MSFKRIQILFIHCDRHCKLGNKQDDTDDIVKTLCHIAKDFVDMGKLIFHFVREKKSLYLWNLRAILEMVNSISSKIFLQI